MRCYFSSPEALEYLSNNNYYHYILHVNSKTCRVIWFRDTPYLRAILHARRCPVFERARTMAAHFLSLVLFHHQYSIVARHICVLRVVLSDGVQPVACDLQTLLTMELVRLSSEPALPGFSPPSREAYRANSARCL